MTIMLPIFLAKVRKESYVVLGDNISPLRQLVWLAELRKSPCSYVVLPYRACRT